MHPNRMIRLTNQFSHKASIKSRLQRLRLFNSNCMPMYPHRMFNSHIHLPCKSIWQIDRNHKIL